MTAPITPPADPLDLLRTRSYVVLLAFGALIGAPIAAVAYLFLKFVDEGQAWLFQDLPTQLGFDSAPVWWPVPVLVLAGLVVALAIERLPGTAGHEPSAGLSPVRQDETFIRTRRINICRLRGVFTIASRIRLYFPS